MSDDLVKRLRCFNLTDFDGWAILDEAADYIEHCHASHDVMAQEIERLTRERDEWKGTAEHLLDIEREWIDANESLAATAKLIEARADAATDLVEIRTIDLHNAIARAEAAERKVEVLREALTKLLARDERNTCQHDETHRGGVLWEICDSCGAQWADDEGGKPEWKDPSEWTAARAALAETEKGDE